MIIPCIAPDHTEEIHIPERRNTAIKNVDSMGLQCLSRRQRPLRLESLSSLGPRPRQTRRSGDQPKFLLHIHRVIAGATIRPHQHPGPPTLPRCNMGGKAELRLGEGTKS